MSTICYPKFKAFAANGSPLFDGLLYTLSAGTTWPVGAKNTFTDKALSNVASNPIHLDANGEALCYGVGQYKLILADANNNTLWTVDNVDGIGTSTNFQSISSFGLSLANANAAMVANGGYVLIDQPITVGTNLTVANSVVLGMVKCANNGTTNVNITMANNANLTILSPFDPPPPFQCFGGSGSVIFGPDALSSTLPAICWGGGSAGAAAANISSANVAQILTVDSATPDVVSGLPLYITNNSVPTTITGFANAITGQTWQVIIGDNNTTISGANIQGSIGTLTTGVALQFSYYNGSSWAVGPPTLAPFRNRIINGEMAIDQRNNGASQTVAANTTVYTLDRWLLSTANGALVTQQSTSGVFPSQFKYSLDINGGAGVTAWNLAQRVESINCSDLANATVTFSAYVYSSTVSAVSIVFSTTGMSDIWSAPTLLSSNNWNINGSAARYFATASLPANAVNGLEIQIAGTSFTSGSLYITGVQLEPGSVPTAFEHRPYDIELERCQRYLPAFQNANNATTIVGTGQITTTGTTAGTALLAIPLPVSSRVPPTGIAFNSANSYLQITAHDGSASNMANANMNTAVSSTNMAFINASNMSVSVTTGYATMVYLANAAGGNGVMTFTGCEL